MNGCIPDLLTEEEEAELYQRFDMEAREKLILGNIRLALYIASSFDSLDRDELESLSLVGLVKAGNSFSPAKNTKFSTYAMKCIRNEILQGIRKSVKSMNIVYFSQPLDGANERMKNISYEDVIEDTTSELAFEKAENFVMLNGIVQGVNKRYREILYLYADGMTQKEIGEKMGISQSYVSRVLRGIYEKIKEDP